jgi:hypothetical protein
MFFCNSPRPLKAEAIGSKKLVVFARKPPAPKGEYIPSNLRNIILINLKFVVTWDILPFRGRGLLQKNISIRILTPINQVLNY